MVLNAQTLLESIISTFGLLNTELCLMEVKTILPMRFKLNAEINQNKLVSHVLPGCWPMKIWTIFTVVIYLGVKLSVLDNAKDRLLTGLFVPLKILLIKKLSTF